MYFFSFSIVTSESLLQLWFPSFSLVCQILGAADLVKRVRCAMLHSEKNQLKIHRHTSDLLCTFDVLQMCQVSPFCCDSFIFIKKKLKLMAVPLYLLLLCICISSWWRSNESQFCWLFAIFLMIDKFSNLLYERVDNSITNVILSRRRSDFQMTCPLDWTSCTHMWVLWSWNHHSGHGKEFWKEFVI